MNYVHQMQAAELKHHHNYVTIGQWTISDEGAALAIRVEGKQAVIWKETLLTKGSCTVQLT